MSTLGMNPARSSPGGGRLLAHVTTASPSWPALAIVERTAEGDVRAELRAEPVGAGRWNVTVQGPRDLWKEIQDLAARWRAAGSPERYGLVFDPDGGQRVASPTGRLSWRLPFPRPSVEGVAS